MTEPRKPVAGEGAADPGTAPQVHVNGGNPLPDDPVEAAPQKPAQRATRTNMPPDPRKR